VLSTQFLLAISVLDACDGSFAKVRRDFTRPFIEERDIHLAIGLGVFHGLDCLFQQLIARFAARY
jgi:hypothetical protein